MHQAEFLCIFASNVIKDCIRRVIVRHYNEDVCGWAIAFSVDYMSAPNAVDRLDDRYRKLALLHFLANILEALP